MSDKTPDNLDDAKGRGKQALGDLSGDEEMKNEGKKDESGEGEVGVQLMRSTR